MRLIISGGGTGGHIYPAISICQTVMKEDCQSEILYVGKKDSLEFELTKKAGLSFCSVEAMGFPRKVGKDMLVSLLSLQKGIKQSKKIIKDFNPDVVMGTGGYVSLPVLMAAQMEKIPTAIHEANSIPGLANKLLSPKSKAVFITLEDSRKRIRTKGKIILSGNPVREEFLKETYEKAEAFGLNENKKIILSFGGSGGQRGLNNALLEIIKEDLLPDDMELLHITGKRHYEGFKKILGDYKQDKYFVMDYSDNMPSLMKLSDLIIASSGMMTLTEISASGKASILIPKPYTTENHQLYNAKSYESQGASIVIEEKDITGEILAKKILDLFEKDDKLLKMGEESRKFFNDNSNLIIYNELKNIIERD